MHFVPAQLPPTCLKRFKEKYLDGDSGRFSWSLCPNEHAELMGDLSRQFGDPLDGSTSDGDPPMPQPGICAYCERECIVGNRRGGKRDQANTNTVDHFFPRKEFNELTFEWTNLMYVCHRCNARKKDRVFGERLRADASAYVNPREEQSWTYFSFEVEADTKLCRIVPNPDVLDKKEWKKATRTIQDLRLNEHVLDKDRNLPVLRGNYLKNLKATVARTNPDLGDWIVRKFAERHHPFSSLVIWAHCSGFLD